MTKVILPPIFTMMFIVILICLAGLIAMVGDLSVQETKISLAILAFCIVAVYVYFMPGGLKNA
jgi:hypothetical protein